MIFAIKPGSQGSVHKLSVVGAGVSKAREQQFIAVLPSLVNKQFSYISCVCAPVYGGYIYCSRTDTGQLALICALSAID